MPGTFMTVTVSLQDDLDEFEGTVEEFLADFRATTEGRRWEIVNIRDTALGPVAVLRSTADEPTDAGREAERHAGLLSSVG